MCEGNAAVELHRGPGPTAGGEGGVGGVGGGGGMRSPGGGAEQAAQLKELTEASIKRTC